MAPALAKATDHLGWIKTLLRYRTNNLKVISAHIYLYLACAQPGQASYPTLNSRGEHAAGTAAPFGYDK